MRSFLSILILTIGFSLVLSLLWGFEQDYNKTPSKPTKFTEIPINSNIIMDEVKLDNKPTLIHFFNPNCPCSKFNFEHFAFLSKKFASQVNFIVATHIKKDESYNLIDLKNKFDENVILINDSKKTLAQKVGVYSTPQAVILNDSNQLLFRGNYNRARFCTDKRTNFVFLTLNAIIQGKELPYFDEIATKPYGCELPGNKI